MYKLLIFGGTTEGRRLAGSCVENGIAADISVATDYGASLLNDGIGVLTGRLDSYGMEEMIRKGDYSEVVDATHPYAVEATANIRRACERTGVNYLRLVRETLAITGTCADSMEQLTELLNKSDSVILSTLGSKSLPELTKVRDYSRRIWLRLLPTEGAAEHCRQLGFDEDKLILEYGPFTTEQNARHIRMSGAQMLVTKDSGAVGGYPEKMKAAELCGIQVITLLRPSESGLSFDKIMELILRRRQQ